MRRSIAFLAAFMFTIPVWGQTSLDGFTNCGSPASAAVARANTSVRPSGVLCFDFDSGFGTGASASFSVQSAATVCLDQDRNSTGGAAVVDIQACPGPDSAGDNTCIDTGITLNASNPCGAVLSGRYRLEVTTAAASTQDAQVEIRGY